MYQAQMLDLNNGDVELGMFETAEEAHIAIENYRVSSGRLRHAARVIVHGENRYYFYP